MDKTYEEKHSKSTKKDKTHTYGIFWQHCDAFNQGEVAAHRNLKEFAQQKWICDSFPIERNNTFHLPIGAEFHRPFSFVDLCILS